VPAGQGFVNSIINTVTTTDSPTGADYYLFEQSIEGFNSADLGWGTASAKSVTISFFVKSSLTGTYTVAIRNSGLNRSYRAIYTIGSANTWEQKTITVAGDTTGTWLTDNSRGISVGFTLGAGSDYISTGNTWSASDDFAATGQTQWIGTNGATFFLTGLQLEPGSTATPFERRSYAAELALCQRYYQRIQGDAAGLRGVGSGVVGDATSIFRAIGPLKCTMRAAPTLSSSGMNAYDASNNSAVSVGSNYSTADSISADFVGGSGYTVVGRIAILLTAAISTSFFAASSEL